MFSLFFKAIAATFPQQPVLPLFVFRRTYPLTEIVIQK
jgi:hypothetical protein